MSVIADHILKFSQLSSSGNYDSIEQPERFMGGEDYDLVRHTDSAEATLLKFNRLVNQWRAETRHMSSVEDICTHRAYQDIINMGDVIVPYILRELEKRPSHWFWALTAITGATPIPRTFQGTFNEAVQIWLDWASQAGYNW